jgi:hypothetical protein
MKNHPFVIASNHPSCLSIARVTILGILVSLLVTPRLAAQNSWDLYSQSTIRAVMAAESSEVALTSGRPEPMVRISAGAIRVRTRLTLVGKSRPLSPTHGAALRHWGTTMGVPGRLIELFQTEFLFREKELDVWLPVQEPVAHHLAQEPEGSVLDGFVAYIGVVVNGEKLDWVFVLNEYTKGHP